MNKKREAKIGILFAMPWILGFLIFMLYPILASLFYSFTNYSVLRPPKMIGIANYQELAGDKVFIQSLTNTIYYLVGSVPLGAALQDVPVSLYEAAELDGAKLWQKTKNVTLPMISPVILFNVVMGMIGALQVFAVPYVMVPGGAPARSTYFFTSYLFDNAFQYQRMGFACAIGWVMFVITLILTLISIKISDRHVHYERS